MLRRTKNIDLKAGPECQGPAKQAAGCGSAPVRFTIRHTAYRRRCGVHERVTVAWKDPHSPRWRAGFNIDKRRVLQDAAGNGTVPDRDATLGSGQFPVFLLRQEWDSDEDETVVRDYLSWIAPAPLTLQPLDEAQRIRLEPQLPVQYLCVEHHWRLFPTRIDRDTLQVARAKNRLQRAL